MTATNDFDAPAASPLFDFDQLAESLSERLLEERQQTAFVLGLHGPWGAGKTTLMDAIRHRLPPSAIVVPFNAWKHADREALWRALILTVLDSVKAHAKTANRLTPERQGRIAELERSLYEGFNVTERGPLQVNWIAAVATTVPLAIGAASMATGHGVLLGLAASVRGLFRQKETAEGKAEDTAKQIERAGTILQRKSIDRAVHHVITIEQFLRLFRELVGELARPSRLYILIDDLDRCLPEVALGIFEAIKLFLDAPECGYVVCVDRAVIRRGLELRYPARSIAEGRQLPPTVDPDEYIEKTITLSVDLPTLADADVVALLSSGPLADRFSPEELEVIVFVLGSNPRRAKRFGSTVTLWEDIAKRVSTQGKQKFAFSPLEATNRPLFLKLCLLGYINSGVLAEMLRDPGLPARLQRYCDAAFSIPEAHQYATSVARRAGQLKPSVLASVQDQLGAELPIVEQALRDPAILRGLRIDPSLADEPEELTAALRWFRAR